MSEHPGFGAAPFRLVHYNGTAQAEGMSANAAWWCWKGMDARSRTYFHFEDANGQRVELHDQPRHPGHAYALLAILDRTDASTPTDKPGAPVRDRACDLRDDGHPDLAADLEHVADRLDAASTPSDQSAQQGVSGA